MHLGLDEILRNGLCNQRDASTSPRQRAAAAASARTTSTERESASHPSPFRCADRSSGTQGRMPSAAAASRRGLSTRRRQNTCAVSAAASRTTRLTRAQDIDGAVPKIRNGTFHFPSGRRTNPLTPDYPPLEKPRVRRVPALLWEGRDGSSALTCCAGRSLPSRC